MTGLEGDVHIAGVLVQCRPLQLLQVQRAVAAIEGADVDRTGAPCPACWTWRWCTSMPSPPQR
jgi:hypothetical protein